MEDAKQVVCDRLSGCAWLPGCDNRRRHIERCLGHGDEQLQGHRTLGLMIVKPCALGGRAIVGRRERGVVRDVRVNLAGAMVTRIEFVKVRVHERGAERSKRDGHRQPDRGQRPNHTVIVGETNRAVKPQV